MKITGIQLKNIRGFKNLDNISFSKNINILIGANNSGKSTILNSIYLLQKPNALIGNDITIGETENEIRLFLEGGHPPQIKKSDQNQYILFSLSNNRRQLWLKNGAHSNISQIPPEEPFNLIYPYLSKRKTVSYSDSINESNANSVLGNFQNLYSKIDRLVTPQFKPGNEQYVKACNEILGFEVSSIAKGNGKQAAYFVHNLQHVPLTAMGEGVANIVGLIVDLCVAENKIFLIEEPENDIHPKALKGLLNLIAEKSINNQFFISTHSNIVMKYLGSVSETKIFNITSKLTDPLYPELFISKMSPISNTPAERRSILEDLGYEFNDFDMWSGWLFLEESSAEIIIRDYLIKWFFPRLLNKLRTFSAGSSSKIISKFDDFNRLFVFLHLEPSYKNKVWVIIDNGKHEKEVIDRLKEVYSKSGWEKNHFIQFIEHDFECYYPHKFKLKVKKVLSIEDKQEKREQKKLLLEDVKNWIEKNEAEAKRQFRVSAKEVIDLLKIIDKKTK